LNPLFPNSSLQNSPVIIYLVFELLICLIFARQSIVTYFYIFLPDLPSAFFNTVLKLEHFLFLPVFFRHLDIYWPCISCSESVSNHSKIVRSCCCEKLSRTLHLRRYILTIESLNSVSYSLWFIWTFVSESLNWNVFFSFDKLNRGSSRLCNCRRCLSLSSAGRTKSMHHYHVFLSIYQNEQWNMDL
jgi:hypothetical protein